MSKPLSLLGSKLPNQVTEVDGGVEGNTKLVGDKVMDGDVEVVGGGVIGTPISTASLLLEDPSTVPNATAMIKMVNMSPTITTTMGFWYFFVQ